MSATRRFAPVGDSQSHADVAVCTGRAPERAENRADMTQTRPALGAILFFGASIVMGLYFTYAAVQGQFGLFNRVQVQAENAILTERRDALRTELATLENRTHRLSDEFLDIDLLDERARAVLGWMRADEVVIR